MREDELYGDDDMMRHLAELAAQVDPVPLAVATAARASFSWADVDSELAELVFDSAMEDRELAGVRGAESRHLTFEGSGVTVEFEVCAGRLVGQVVPPHATQIEVCRADGSFLLEADELGRFGADPIASGPLRLRVGDATSGVQTATEWVAI
jgi:hypothetical protein